MPFIGEQPAESATLKIISRSTTVEVELTSGVLAVVARSGTINVGVE
jgi:hypothetical protein